MILKCAGDNFRSRRRSPIDQHHNRQSGCEIAGLGRIAPHFTDPVANGHNFTVVKKSIGDGNRLIQQSTGIIAQIEYDPFQTAFSPAFDTFKSLFQRFLRRLDEMSEADNPDITLPMPFDRLDLNDGPRDGNLEIAMSRAANG